MNENRKKLEIVRKTLNIDGWSAYRTKVNTSYYFAVYDENNEKIMARNMGVGSIIIVNEVLFKHIKHAFTNGGTLSNIKTAEILKIILKEDFNLTNVNPEPNEYL